jgi:hypothetical protein
MMGRTTTLAPAHTQLLPDSVASSPSMRARSSSKKATCDSAFFLRWFFRL